MSGQKDKTPEVTLESQALLIAELEGKNEKLTEEVSELVKDKDLLCEANNALNAEIEVLSKKGEKPEAGAPKKGLVATVRVNGVKRLRGTTVEELSSGENKLTKKEIESLGDKIDWMLAEK